MYKNIELMKTTRKNLTEGTKLSKLFIKKKHAQ